MISLSSYYYDFFLLAFVLKIRVFFYSKVHFLYSEIAKIANIFSNTEKQLKHSFCINNKSKF
jgi:hypothetical protein